MRPLLLSPEGAELTREESAFFRELDPLGFILFAEHCRSQAALRQLCADLRDSVGRDALIAIDQEGGRVARLRPPHFVSHYPAALFGLLWRADRERACEAARINAVLLARMCSAHGISVNAMPVLDLAYPGSDPISIGDRAFSDDPVAATELGRAAVAGSLAGGVAPVIKHIPGLGRAKADSHFERPVIKAPRIELLQSDFNPFAALANAPIAMTNHATYEAYDRKLPTTISPPTIQQAIRDDIGFGGLLLSDALLMGAMPQGWYPWQLCQATLSSGCDVAVIPHLKLPEAEELFRIAEISPTSPTAARIDHVYASMKSAEPESTPDEELYKRLDELMMLVTR